MRSSGPTMLPPSIAAGPNTPANPSSNAPPLRRVLHVVHGEHYLGTERVQDLLGALLPEFGYEVGYACIRPAEFPLKRESQEPILYKVPMQSKFDLRPARILAQIVKFGGYEVLHAHTPQSALVSRIASTLANVPLVYHVHSAASEDSRGTLSNWVNLCTERIALASVSKLVCVSHSLAHQMRQRGYDSAVINVVPNGAPRRFELWHRDTPTGEWVIGTVGRFGPRAGTRILLESLSILRKQGHRVRLRAVGNFETPAFETRLRRCAEHYGIGDVVEWTEITTDVNHELDQMDILAFPSLYGEGLPMVILEAMAAGVPVVGTRTQGVPELLTEGNGLLATPGCPKDLADCIRSLVCGSSNWEKMRESAWQTQARDFSARDMAAGVAKIYDSLFTAGFHTRPARSHHPSLLGSWLARR